MLFSREDVAAFVNKHFEPAWEMVRPVPIVRIDFGNGTVATRTLHGNVASYVCDADGQVVDILPGIYTPTAYTSALERPRALAEALSALQVQPQLTRLREYHRAAAQRLLVAQPRPGDGLVPLDPGKKTIERPVERIVIPAAPSSRRPRTAAELANWQPLVADTLVNETQRRRQIHERLALAERQRPDQIKPWLYRDVLHADLADPYLGLGDDFFADIER
ncbi:MAG: hypothetical protein EXS16_01955 [Gemmataceae bacterium]|nr:hypothetical protein [Gemmataceae bacterium]